MNWLIEYRRTELVDKLLRICRPFEIEDLDAAIAGDADAARNLSGALNDNRLRGDVAVALWRAQIPVTAFRAYLSGVWDNDLGNHYLVHANTRRTLRAMLRYAAFPLPDELPDLVTVWRGTSKTTIDQAKSGYSWTTDRDTACWFAMKHASADRPPLVITARVAKTDVALFHDERDEREVVLMRPPATVTIDGTQDDWAQGHKRRQDGLDADLKAQLWTLPSAH